MADAFIRTLIVNSLVFAALFGVVMALRAALRKRLSATLSLVLWAVLALKLALPFGFESALSPFGWFAGTPASQEAVLTPAVTAQAFPSDYLSGPRPESISLPLPIAATHAPAQPVVSSQPVAAVQPSPAPAAPLRWTDWALLIWASGAVGVAVWLLLGQVALNRRLRMAKEPSATALAMLHSCKAELGIRADVALKVLPGGSPAIAGLLRPTVLLADGLDDDADALRPVLLHELHHLRNGDLFVILAMNLLTVIYWFHPLVWALFALARRDMETRCDQQVLFRLSREGGLGYVSTLLHFSGYGARERLRAALGWSRLADAARPSVLGMGSGRAPMERRIRDMFRSRRADAATRAVALLAAVVMLAASVLTACQPTPEKPAVVNKNDGKLEAAIKATVTPSATPTGEQAQSSEATAPVPTPFPAPKHLKYDLPGAKDDFAVQVDAEVQVPETGVFPVVKATGDVFTQEMVDKVRETLLPGVTLYQPTEIMTKKDIQEQIDSYQEQLADAVENNYAQLIKDYKKILKDLMAQQAKAPETVEQQPADMTLHFPQDSMKLLTMYGKEVEVEGGMRFEWTPEGLKAAENDGYLSLTGVTPFLNGGGQGRFHVTTMQAGKSPRFTVQYIQYGAPNGMGDSHIDGLSPEAAEAMGQELLQKMGLPFSLVEATVEGFDANPEFNQKENHSYRLIYKRDVGTVRQNVFTRPRYREEEMAANDKLREEEISLTIDNNGLQGFNWNDPVCVLEMENANVLLLSFEDVKAIFDKQIVTTYEARRKEDDEIQSQRLVIYKVTLTAMPIRIQNDPKAFRYVPVWDFCGKLIGKYADNYPNRDTDYYITDVNHERVVMGQGESRDDTQNMSFLTINAIDGSIIDRNKGY